MQIILSILSNIITYLVIGILTCITIIIILLSKLSNAVKTLRDLQGLEKDKLEIEKLKLDINTKKSRIYLATINDIEKFDSTTKQLIAHILSNSTVITNFDRIPNIFSPKKYLDVHKISLLICYCKFVIVILSIITIVLIVTILLIK